MKIENEGNEQEIIEKFSFIFFINNMKHSASYLNSAEDKKEERRLLVLSALAYFTRFINFFFPFASLGIFLFLLLLHFYGNELQSRLL